MKTTKRFKFTEMRKYRGDDLYSWAVFRKGESRPVHCGMGKSEAAHMRGVLEREISEKASKK